MIDLHSHTTCSDGSLTPKELIDLAHKKDLQAISITDHDTIDGLDEGRKRAEELGICFLNGIELAGSFKAEAEIHILGYNFDITDDLEYNLSNIVVEREKRNIEIISLLQEENINISLDDLKAISGEKIISRAHFASLMIDKGYVRTKDEAFSKYLNPGCKTYVPRKYFTPKDCIDLIHRANGVAVLAHPTLYGIPFMEVKELIWELKALRLDGVEVKHSTYNYEQEAFLTNFAKKEGLLKTGGSDFHGSFKKALNLGTGYGKLYVPFRMYEYILNLKK